MTEQALSAGSIALRIGLVLLLVAANGFFVAAEFGLVGARRTQIESLVRRGNRRARAAQHAISHLDHYISGTQLGITVSSLGLGWVGESTMASMLNQLFTPLGPPLDVIATHAVAATIAFIFISFLHIVLGELAPKSLALLFPEQVSLWTATPLIVFSRVFTPFIYVLNGTANRLLRLFGLRPPRHLEHVHRPEEIEMLVRQMHEHDQLADEPVHMIRGALALSERMVSDVMTPRTEVIALEVDTPLQEAADIFLDTGVSRIPVYREVIDDVIGVVLARDIWRASTRARPTPLSELVRPATYVPDTKSVEELLGEMQRQRIHMAIVIDEFGGTAGVVTLEDLIEEIVGDIRDEDEREPEPIRETGDGIIQLSGNAPLVELNERFELGLPAHEFTTVGGYVMGRLGRLATPGDVVEFTRGKLRVDSMHGRRIETLTLSPERPVVAEEQER
ncbi:MAG: hemolysin family protein [Longimicrobiales bacterium]